MEPAEKRPKKRDAEKSFCDTLLRIVPSLTGNRTALMDIMCDHLDHMLLVSAVLLELVKLGGEPHEREMVAITDILLGVCTKSEELAVLAVACVKGPVNGDAAAPLALALVSSCV